MTIDLTTEIECTALLAARHAQGRTVRVELDDGEKGCYYQIQENDLRPEGLRVGEFIHGMVKKGVAVYVSHGS